MAVVGIVAAVVLLEDAESVVPNLVVAPVAVVEEFVVVDAAAASLDSSFLAACDADEFAVDDQPFAAVVVLVVLGGQCTEDAEDVGNAFVAFADAVGASVADAYDVVLVAESAVDEFVEDHTDQDTVVEEVASSADASVVAVDTSNVEDVSAALAAAAEDGKVVLVAHPSVDSCKASAVESVQAFAEVHMVLVAVAVEIPLVLSYQVVAVVHQKSRHQ